MSIISDSASSMAGIFAPLSAQAQAQDFDCTNATGLPTDECEALVVLFNTADGPNWIVNEGWLQTPTPCTWHGVGCALDHVVKVELTGNGLTGRIPPQLSMLSELVFLHLDSNQLDGLLPVELGALDKLGIMNLSNNRLRGAIPVEYSQLTALAALALEGNFLSGSIPGELGQLPNLNQLILDGNNLTGPIPTELARLSNLSLLTLGRNELTGPIPVGLASLKQLATLRLESNELTGPIPSELSKLAQLTTLRLDANQLSGPIPAQIGQLSKLQILTLSVNELSDVIPPLLSRLQNLQFLDLQQNQLDGPVPPELGQLKTLNYLDLSDNQLSGTIPTEFQGFSALQTLDLSNNQLEGTIPPELGRLPFLYQLSLANNSFSGSLPSELFDLASLSDLNLANNSLTGTLPEKLGSLRSLTEVSFRNNEFTGAIPASVADLENLVAFNVSQNQLDGAIPAGFGNLASLTLLKLDNNRLTGPLPAELGSATSLVELTLQNNELQGDLPISLTGLANLDVLDIGRNRLTTDSDELRTFLTTKDPDWLTSQLVPPTELQALPESSGSVVLTWLPIADRSGSGYYSIELAEVDEESGNIGTFQEVGLTVSKRAAGFTIQGLSSETTYAFRLRTVETIPNGDDVTDAQLSDHSRIVQATTPALFAGDLYEVNDSCSQAQAILTDGAGSNPINSTGASLRTFHRPGDVDWVQFEAEAGTRYRIDALIPPGSQADVNLEVYPSCEAADPDQLGGDTFGPDAFAEFTANQSGTLFVKVSHADAAVGNDALTYRLTVRDLSQEAKTGALILVAGRLRSEDALQQNIHKVTQDVYDLFTERGYTDQDIHFLATDATLPGYDGPATVENLRRAITGWASERVSSERALTLYIMDHGDQGMLYLDKVNGQIITPGELHAWLTQLETAIPDVPVNVIIEACLAGSFIGSDQQSSVISSISKPGRVVITSTNQENWAYASQKGAYFSDQFLTALRQGHNLFNGFWEANAAVSRLNTQYPQEPWLDADGDGIPNEIDDAAIASIRGFGFPGTFAGEAEDVRPPHISLPPDVTIPDPQAMNPDGELTIDVNVQDNLGLARVWAVVYAPNYRPPTNRDELVPEDPALVESIRILELNADIEGDRYTASYDAFAGNGDYRIVVHAEDTSGLRARPLLYQGDSESEPIRTINLLYMPLMLR